MQTDSTSAIIFKKIEFGGGGWGSEQLIGWLIWFNGPLRQYFSLYRAVSQREGEREEKG